MVGCRCEGELTGEHDEVLPQNDDDLVSGI